MQQIECLRCNHPFSIHDVVERRYFIPEMTCVACYQELQAADGCFGKPSEVDKPEAGVRAEDEECSQWCPDRRICRWVVLDEALERKQRK